MEGKRGRREKLFLTVDHLLMYPGFYCGGEAGDIWELGKRIRFRTYNIQNGRNGGLESLLHRIS